MGRFDGKGRGGSKPIAETPKERTNVMLTPDLKDRAREAWGPRGLSGALEELGRAELGMEPLDRSSLHRSTPAARVLAGVASLCAEDAIEEAAQQTKPTIPEVVERFARYRRQHSAWGALHVVLDDGNTEDGFIESAARRALDAGDVEGAELALVLGTMSRTQRRKLPSAVRDWLASDHE